MLESSRKKLWQACGKWSHDRYQVDYQRPKTARELIGLYGYDIRTSDKPPELPPMSLGRGRYFQSPFLVFVDHFWYCYFDSECPVHSAES